MINMKEPGEKAPLFCLKDKDEKKHCLKDHLDQNKWVVLYFYPKDNTSGCTLEALQFTKYKNQFEERNALVIGISPDSCLSHQKFIAKHQLTILLLSDSEHLVLKDYEVWKKKKMYGREFFGVERSTCIINPDGNILFSWEKVKVTDHVEDVFSKLVSLQDKH